jgi:GT2 family glycosyltransferase
MNFAIGIPTYNRMDLLLPSVIKYITTDFPEVNIHIIDNGNQHIKFLETMPNVKVYEQIENIGVAASWNKLCKKIYEKHDFALIVNDDVYLGYNTKVVEKAMAECQSGFSQSNASWSVFLMHKEFYDFVGDFDEIFYPAYYEDSDYLYRMKLLGIKQDIDSFLDPKEVNISMTYERAPDMVNQAMKDNKQRYIEKWGNLPLLENYIKPYNL